MRTKTPIGRPRLSQRPSTDAVAEVRAALQFTQEEMARELKCSLDTVRKMEQQSRLPGTHALKANFELLAKRANIVVPNLKTMPDNSTEPPKS